MERELLQQQLARLDLKLERLDLVRAEQRTRPATSHAGGRRRLPAAVAARQAEEEQEAREMLSRARAATSKRRRPSSAAAAAASAGAPSSSSRRAPAAAAGQQQQQQQQQLLARFSAKSASELQLAVSHRRRLAAGPQRDPSLWLLDRARPVAEGPPRRGPPRAGAYRKCAVPARGSSESLPTRYNRREVPFKVMHERGQVRIVFTVPDEQLDVARLLPLMLDGLRTADKPGEPRFRELARQGVEQLCRAARRRGLSLCPLARRLVVPLRDALATKDAAVVALALRALLQLLAADRGLGGALLPFLRVLLPKLGIFLTCRHNLGDGIDYAQRTAAGGQRRTLRPARPLARPEGAGGGAGGGGRGRTLAADESHAVPDNGYDIGGLALSTLEALERSVGYEKGFRAIKAQVPTYESCLRPPSHAALLPEEQKREFVQIDRGP